ncbi:MAG: OstA-like protein [Flavobacteriaceae bacterium]|nr:OstA-like protein [Flavobacteriaceae bacterium]MBT3918934.1 OstA-like protein [Flavobacteriaceae bacterium]MBT6704557.1 OstA-like protein [Flavobacteriaceae bacterium]MBT7243098.1 OstA-like protein [Flavobacteriaceae bacterium]
MKLNNYIILFLFVFFGSNLIAQEETNTPEEKTQITIKSGYWEKKPEFPDAVIYTRDNSGQVYIVHDGVEMWCDQAYVYTKDNFVKAYGSVNISQGDTIFMRSKYAEYNGNTQFAFASGNVAFNDSKTSLKTDTLYFDRIKQQAFYRSSGTIKDTASILTSSVGRYFADSKKYQFLSNVVIKNPKYTINSEQLDFYSESGIAYLYGKSIIKGETSTVYCERGYYNTRNDIGYFVKKSRIDYENRTIYGDSIYFDRNKNFASATNNIRLIDTLNNSFISGHYAEVFKEKDSVFITKRAVAITVRDNDSIYVHADTLRITGKADNRILRGYYKARFFKKGLPGEEPTSGKCDSIYVNEKTGITKLLRKPILWTGENQMTGDTIHLLRNIETSKLDTLKVFKNAFIIQKDSAGYNQVKGERLIGLFTNNELDTINIEKNTQVIFFSRNEEQELVGINNTISSSIQMYLEKQQTRGIRFNKKVNGKLYPPSQFPENARVLPGFNWYGDERLFNVNDLFRGKPTFILAKIKGIPLPKIEDNFFDENSENELQIPKASKLSPEHFKNKSEDTLPLEEE